MNKYFRHKLKNLLVVNDVFTIHYLECDRRFIHESERHDFWEAVYVDNGRAVCTAENQTIQLNRGEMLFHKPNEAHSLSSDGKSTPDVFIMCFNCRSEAMRFFEGRKVAPTPQQVKIIYTILEEAEKTFAIPHFAGEPDKMTPLDNPALGGEQLIKNYLEILLIDIIRSLTEAETGNNIFLSDAEMGNKLTDDVIKLLGENIYGTISISDICRKTSYSRAYIFRQFKAATGVGVMKYFSELKIKEAKKLLRASDMSVREISETLAFDTPNYFSKLFKKLTGVTPQQYKKRVKNG